MQLRSTLAVVGALAVLAWAGFALFAHDDPTSPPAHEHPASSTGHDAEGGDHATDHADPLSTASLTPPPGADWNAQDATYVTAMLLHHRQAIVMSKLAPSRSTSPRLLRLARGIDAGQAGEILVMAGWLADRDLPVPTVEQADAMADHAMPGMDGPGTEGMDTMPGMLSAADLDALRAAAGSEFDELYLNSMIGHHEGAVTMAEQEAGLGYDIRVKEWATEVIAGQTAEINRMRALLDELTPTD